MNWQTWRGHALVAIAIAMGIVGMGMVFDGAMDASLREMSRGVPLLLIGLWWAGHELGRSMRASRRRRERDVSWPTHPVVTKTIRARDQR